jgi:hypothetical protein
MLKTFAAIALVTLGLIPLSGAQSIRKAVDPEIEAAVMRVLDDFLVGLNTATWQRSSVPCISRITASQTAR